MFSKGKIRHLNVLRRHPGTRILLVPCNFTVLILHIFCELAYRRVQVHTEEQSHVTDVYWRGVRTWRQAKSVMDICDISVRAKHCCWEDGVSMRWVVMNGKRPLLLMKGNRFLQQQTGSTQVMPTHEPSPWRSSSFNYKDIGEVKASPSVHPWIVQLFQ